MNYFALIIGGIIGGVLRYVIQLFVPCPAGFPMGTLFINLLGAFTLGMFYRIAEIRMVAPWLRVGLGAGLIGSFTTFSTLCLEISGLLHSSVILALSYGLISMVGGPALAFLGDGTPVFIRQRLSRTSVSPEEQYP